MEVEAKTEETKAKAEDAKEWRDFMHMLRETAENTTKICVEGQNQLKMEREERRKRSQSGNRGEIRENWENGEIGV